MSKTFNDKMKERYIEQKFKGKETRTIENLCLIEAKHLYLWFPHALACRDFNRRAEPLGIDKLPFDTMGFIGLNPDGSTPHCGMASHLNFRRGDGVTDTTIRIDYWKFINGLEHFMFRSDD